MKDGICGFENNEARFLSNFFPARVLYEGIDYPTSEHAFQAAKARTRDEKISISKLSTPGQAKSAGRRLVYRDDWYDIRDQVMEDVVRIKFTINEDLKEKLKSTGDLYLEETNSWGDVYWGVYKDRGKNMLGKILMKVRDEISS